MELDETLKQIQDAGLWKTTIPVALPEMTDAELQSLRQQIEKEVEGRQQTFEKDIADLGKRWKDFDKKLNVSTEITLTVPIKLHFKVDESSEYKIVDIGSTNIIQDNTVEKNPYVKEIKASLQTVLDEINAHVKELAKRHKTTETDIWDSI